MHLVTVALSALAALSTGSARVQTNPLSARDIKHLSHLADLIVLTDLTDFNSKHSWASCRN